MKPTKTDKLPVTKRALSQRINRKLTKAQQRLVFNNLTAQLHLIDIQSETIIENGIDLAVLGAKLGVFHKYETLVEGEDK
jgi:predicted metal-dependent HD superfamily phosphohydrolase